MLSESSLANTISTLTHHLDFLSRPWCNFWENPDIVKKTHSHFVNLDNSVGKIELKVAWNDVLLSLTFDTFHTNLCAVNSFIRFLAQLQISSIQAGSKLTGALAAGMSEGLILRAAPLFPAQRDFQSLH